MKLIYFISTTVLLSSAAIKTNGQGCVAIRSNGNSCSFGNPGTAKGWQMNFNNRYFKSYKHFVGSVEQKEREENNTEVINHTYSLDITATRNFNARWSVGMTLPIISNKRSSLYEHGGNNLGSSARHNTSSFGIGDMRVSVYCWLFNPAKNNKGNMQAGIGIKLPTGDYQYQDYFYKSDGSVVLGPVDQSIQLGDGGTGFTLELNGYYQFNHKFGLYGNFYYLLNPREQNGVSTARGGTANATAVKYFTNTMSVPDQYMVRGGASYMTGKFSFTGGIRLEAVPSSDLIGGDKGFRRPGFVTSFEPVFTYQAKKATFYLSVPVALERNRTKSYADKLRSTDTGTDIHGDAAFADYAVTAGLSFRF